MKKIHWKKTSYDTWQWKGWTITWSGLWYNVDGLRFDYLSQAKQYCVEAEGAAP